MTLNHSKTWPVNTVAVVQLRVDPHGRAYSTLTDPVPFVPAVESVSSTDAAPKCEIANNASVNNPNASDAIAKKKEDATVLPLSRRHLELFTRMSGPSFRTTIRTDTVSTTLEQDTDYDNIEDTGLLVKLGLMCV